MLAQVTQHAEIAPPHHNCPQSARDWPAAQASMPAAWSRATASRGPETGHCACNMILPRGMGACTARGGRAGALGGRVEAQRQCAAELQAMVVGILLRGLADNPALR